MLREARRRAGLSQAELGERAGVGQSVISAYESGHREPGFRTLAKLIEATGHHLVIDLRPTSSRLLGLADTKLGRKLRRHRRAVIECAERRRARNVRVFGSVARGEDTATSDIDLLVDLDEGASLLDLAGLGLDLEEMLGTRVDVVPASGLKPRIRDEVLSEAIPL